MQGWVHVFQPRGHQIYIWNGSKVFDTFIDFRPDVFINDDRRDDEILSAIEINKPIVYNQLFSRPHYRADTVRYYPVEGDFGVSYVGNYNSKKEYIDHFILPLCISNFPIKIFGYGDWPVPNFLGFCSDETERQIYSSGTIINFTNSVNERIFKVHACKGIILSLRNSILQEFYGNDDLLFSTLDELKEKIEKFKNKEYRNKIAQDLYNKVVTQYTYYHFWSKEEWL